MANAEQKKRAGRKETYAHSAASQIEARKRKRIGRSDGSHSCEANAIQGHELSKPPRGFVGCAA
jgi:ribosome assembly protein YihI (activator of Der GTPase)